MFEIIAAIILGIIQGLGEFLPISSSGHLVLAHQFLSSRLENLSHSQELAFDVALHWGTLLAVLFFFRREIIQGAKRILESYRSSKSWKVGKQVKEMKLVTLIVIATIPGALVGYFLAEIVDIFRNPKVVATTLLFYGLLLLMADRYCLRKEKLNKKNLAVKKKLSFQELSIPKALIIGVTQALAFIPGTSRSGVTITSGLFLGLGRKEAAIFSFALSIPIIAGASLIKVPALFATDINILAIMSGILTSFVIGFLAIKYMLKYLTSQSYLIFVFYRLGLAILIFWLIK
ncbi:MAG: undecaprenyl-diphosphate phosphatase [Patescibacteria group bacterium]|nr:undecaprenyl-diphosphate phosphatase [Patescibacteria group bacterium]